MIAQAPAMAKQNPTPAVIPIVPATVQQIDISLIDGADFNPETRTTGRATHELYNEISTMGLLNPVHVVAGNNGRYTLVDGHRRLTVCELIGYTSLPAVVHQHQSVAALWSSLNRGNRKITQYEWLVAYSTSSRHGQVSPPGKVLSHIKTCVTMYGSMAAVRKAFDVHKTSPNIVTEVLMCAKYLGTQFPSVAKLPTLQHRQICDWMITHKMQDDWVRMVNTQAQTEKLYKAIKNNLPITVPAPVKKMRAKAKVKGKKR